MLNACERRIALRVASAYRTVSAEAGQVIAGMMSIHLLVLERSERYYIRDTLDKQGARERTLDRR